MNLRPDHPHRVAPGDGPHSAHDFNNLIYDSQDLEKYLKLILVPDSDYDQLARRSENMPIMLVRLERHGDAGYFYAAKLSDGQVAVLDDSIRAPLVATQDARNSKPVVY